MLNTLLAQQKENAVLWFPVLTGAGIALYFAQHSEPDFWIGFAALFVLVLAVLYSALIAHRQIPVIIFMAMMLIALGWCSAQFRTMMVAAPVLKDTMKYASIEGVIHTIDTLDEGKGVRILIKNPAVEELSPQDTPSFIRISVRKYEGLKAGQRIKVLAGLNPPAAPVAPDGYDFQRHAYFERIGAYGFAYRAPEILEQTSAGWLERFRQDKADYVAGVLDKPAVSSIVSALLLGERAAIPEDTWEDIRAAGLAHVISISGLHISMIAIGVFFVARLIMAMIPSFALRYPIKKYAAFLGLLSAIAYGCMVGLEIPTLRSIIMTGLILLAVMLDRDPFSMRLVALAAFVILLIQPETITNPGFQMSFGAVAALIFFYAETRSFWTALRRRITPQWVMWCLIWIFGACFTSVIATLATTPFTIYHFQQFPIYSVVGNLLALPVIGLIIMPAAILAYCLMPFGLESVAIWLMGLGVDLMLVISHEIAAWPYASLDLVKWPLSSILFMVAGCLWVMIFKGWRVRMAAIMPFIAALYCILSYKPADILASSSTKLMMIVTQDHEAWLSNKRGEKFSAENWLMAAGIPSERISYWPKEGTLGSEGNDMLACDISGCHAVLKAQNIAFSFEPYTMASDCASAALILSTEAVAKSVRQYCVNTDSGQSPVIIDRWDLRYKGAHEIRITDNGDIIVRNVKDARGERPWTASGHGRK